MRAAAEKERLFSELYDKHGPAVRAVVARLAGPALPADDLCHDVFVVAWNKLDGLPEIPGRGWLCSIAIKVVAGARRRARFRHWVGLDEAAHLGGERTPATDFAQREASELVYAALERLSEKKRTTFILFHLQGLTGEQIASILDVPVKTVWSRLAHARREFEFHLRKRLKPAELALEEAGVR